jgi:hypothetical protein
MSMDVGIKIAKNEFIIPEPVKRKDPKRGAGYLKGIVNLPPGWDSPEADQEFENLFEAVREAKGLPTP